jgi:hypothetical protein
MRRHGVDHGSITAQMRLIADQTPGEVVALDIRVDFTARRPAKAAGEMESQVKSVMPSIGA